MTLAAAAAAKGYLLPVCVTLVYVLAGFFLMNVDLYLYLVCAMAVILLWQRGIALSQPGRVPLALACIATWGGYSALCALILA